MSNEVWRGSSLGTHSFESETNVVYAERIQATFRCVNGHLTEVTFSKDAELPETWACKHCSEEGKPFDENSPTPLATESAKSGRSHWQMLLERRTTEELEEILQEQLTLLRQRRANGQVEF
jgi:hypothetical protein